MKSLIFLLLAAVVVWGYFHFAAPKVYPPGILIENAPVQLALGKSEEPVQKGKFTLTLLATYSIDARVLHTKHYWSGEIASLAPYDVVVGWGRMSDQGVLDHLKISQGNRFYFWEYVGDSPIPENEIISSSANMHLIPSTFAVRNTIAFLRSGDLVRMEGWLVQVTAPGMSPWRSSLSRTDTGNGSCEIMLVNSIQSVSVK